MYKIATALILMSSSAFAQNAYQNAAAFSDCPAIGKTAGGEMVYGLDCKALKAENKSSEYKPGMSPGAMQDTVIPKSGGAQTPEATPVSGVNK